MFALRNNTNATGLASSVSPKTNAKNNVINCRRGQLLKKRFPNTSRRAKAKAMSIRNGPETVPIVVPLGDGSQQQDLFTFLVNNRIVFIGERIDEDSTAIIVAQMLALESEAPNEPITLYINATAGTQYCVVAIVDAMERRFERNLRRGQVASVGVEQKRQGAIGVHREIHRAGLRRVEGFDDQRYVLWRARGD